MPIYPQNISVRIPKKALIDFWAQGEGETKIRKETKLTRSGRTWVYCCHPSLNKRFSQPVLKNLLTPSLSYINSQYVCQRLPTIID